MRYTTNALMAFVNKALVLEPSATACPNCFNYHNVQLCPESI